MPTVYIETMIVSYLTARPSRDLIRAAHQQITRDWWDLERGSYDLFTSPLVLIEAAGGDATAAADRLAILKQIPVLPDNPNAEPLAEALLAGAALPAVAARDALHVAITATARIDYLLTWNCRHLANAALRDKIAAVVARHGYRPPVICTPEELREVVS